MKNIKDNFSSHAKNYFQFRPHYPDSLYSFIYAEVSNFNSAWDCGTGNGQVAHKLSEKFQKVFATDISEQQLKNAIPKNNITYFITRAEKTNFPDNTFDLITVAQALHWFDLKEFYKEVHRVAKHDSVIAVLGYKLLNVSPEIDSIILDFYNNTVGKFWDVERRLVDEEYKTIFFPFEEIQTPSFQITVSWKIEQLLNYLSTWSSVQKFIKENKSNPIDIISPQIKSLWEKEEAKEICFPVFMRMGKIK